jgi:hypothetical protein
MNIKSKMVLFNFIIFLIIFDVIYLTVWIFSIQMNPVKAVIVTGTAALLTPWVRHANHPSGQKVVIRSIMFSLYHKYLKK